MEANDVLALGVASVSAGRLVSQRLDTATQPNELHLEVSAERGALFPWPTVRQALQSSRITWRIA